MAAMWMGVGNIHPRIHNKVPGVRSLEAPLCDRQALGDQVWRTS